MTRAAGEPSGTPPPLAGLRVVVTRPAVDVEPLTRALTALGAEVHHLPMLAFEPPPDPGPLARAVAQWEAYDWVAFTSPRGVTAVAEAFRASGSDPGRRPPPRLAVVGPTTAAAARAVGWAPELVPERFDAEGLLAAMDGLSEPLSKLRILLPVAEAARETLAAGLRDRGARVDVVIAYRSTGPASLAPESAAGLLDDARSTLITFTSPSTARHFLVQMGARVLELPVAAIGPVTADQARALGYRVVAVPDDHTLDGLTAAVLSWWQGQ